MTRALRLRWRLAVLTVVVAAALVVTGGARQLADETGAARVLVEDGAELSALDDGTLDSVEPVDAFRRSAVRARTGRTGWPYEPGKVIVKFKEGISSARREGAAALARELGAFSVERPSDADFHIVRIDLDADPEAFAAALAERGDVEYAQAAYRVYPYFTPNDPQFAQQWNMSLIGMQQAWDINAGASSDVVVAVLDTGVAFKDAQYQYFADSFENNGVQYPALGRIVVPFAAAPDLATSSRFAAPYDFIWNDANPVDMDGHGTHVSGTIGQLTDNSVSSAGVAFKARIMPVKCISSTWDDIFASPNVGTDDIVAQAIRYAADNGAKVINLSLGRNGGPEATVVGQAMRYAVSKGAFITVAGGNDYEDGNPIERLAEQAAPIPGAIVVAAVGPDGNRAYYSGIQSYIEIAAPGGNRRVSSNGGIWQQTYNFNVTDTFDLPPNQYGPPRFDVFATISYVGTSMATAHVAGVGAMLASQGITSPAAIEAALKRFATDKGAEGRDNEYGEGLVNPRATLRGFGIAR